MVYTVYCIMINRAEPGEHENECLGFGMTINITFFSV